MNGSCLPSHEMSDGIQSGAGLVMWAAASEEQEASN